jgi:hypothetical protein
MVLRSWFEAGLVPIDLVLEYFRNLKSRRKGKKDVTVVDSDTDS